MHRVRAALVAAFVALSLSFGVAPTPAAAASTEEIAAACPFAAGLYLLEDANTGELLGVMVVGSDCSTRVFWAE